MPGADHNSALLDVLGNKKILIKNSGPKRLPTQMPSAFRSDAAQLPAKFQDHSLVIRLPGMQCVTIQGFQIKIIGIDTLKQKIGMEGLIDDLKFFPFMCMVPFQQKGIRDVDGDSCILMTLFFQRCEQGGVFFQGDVFQDVSQKNEIKFIRNAEIVHIGDVVADMVHLPGVLLSQFDAFRTDVGGNNDSFVAITTEQAGEDAYAATDLQHGAVAPQTQLFEIAENRAVADIDAGF